MEITKVVKPFIRRRWPNTFGNIVYIYIRAVRWASHSAAEAFKDIAAKKPHSQLLWCLLIKDQKKKAELNNCCSFTDSPILHLVYDNFIQFLYISYLLKGIMGLCEDCYFI